MKTVHMLIAAACAICFAAVASSAEDGPSDGLNGTDLQTIPACDHAVLFPCVRLSISGFVSTAQKKADDFFVTPHPGKPYLETEDIPVDTFHDRFRIGFDSGIIYPLVAQKADYNAGWWARVYGQAALDLGYPGFRTAAELGVSVGQSQSSRSGQPYRITSNYTFITVRGLIDLMPTATADIELYAGIGIGIEIASGHVQRTISSVIWVEEANSTNFNPLVEFGAVYGFELTKGMYFTFKAGIIHPLGSRNILLFSEFEIGIQFLFM